MTCRNNARGEFLEYCRVDGAAAILPPLWNSGPSQTNEKRVRATPMHRAAALARLSQDGNVFLTTFSKTLAARLSQGMDTLLGPTPEVRKRVEVRHLHAYAYAHVSRIETPAVADQSTVDELIGEACRKLGGDFDAAFLRAEWDAVIDFWGITSFDGYREVPRTGRGAALSPRARQRFWNVFAEVRQGLATRKLNTFGEICDRVRLRIEADGTRPFQYVVVDEAQDFGPRELKLVAALAAPGERALYFAGDVGQRIYRWPFSWLAAGIDVRGRAQRLKVNYRTSAEIRRFSDRLLPTRLPNTTRGQTEAGQRSDENRETAFGRWLIHPR
jgi:hypothetical protein